MIQFQVSLLSPCAQQGLSDLISFTFSVQANQKVHQESHRHTRTHSQALSHTYVPLTGLKHIALITSLMLSTGTSSEQFWTHQTGVTSCI